MLTGFGFRVPQLVQIMQGGLNSFVSALVHFIHSKKNVSLYCDSRISYFSCKIFITQQNPVRLQS